MRPRTIRAFLDGLPLTFQRGRAGALSAVYHFTFRGPRGYTGYSEEGQADGPAEATVTVRAGTLEVRAGHHGVADVSIEADARTWLGFLARERSLLAALLLRRVRVRGPLQLLRAFGRCFPRGRDPRRARNARAPQAPGAR